MIAPVPRQVRIEWGMWEDDMARERHLEAKAIDLRTGLPVVSLDRFGMFQWLRDNGFRWVTAVNGVWVRS
jgi:hypothetical protein